jgi:lysozyme family protein
MTRLTGTHSEFNKLKRGLNNRAVKIKGETKRRQKESQPKPDTMKAYGETKLPRKES